MRLSSFCCICTIVALPARFRILVHLLRMWGSSWAAGRPPAPVRPRGLDALGTWLVSLLQISEQSSPDQRQQGGSRASFNFLQIILNVPELLKLSFQTIQDLPCQGLEFQQSAEAIFADRISSHCRQISFRFLLKCFEIMLSQL